MIEKKNIIILCFLTLGGLSVQCQSSNVVKRVEYITLTRGYQKQITIRADSVIISVEGRQEDQRSKRAISKVEWDGVREALKQVKLSEIPSLPSPSMKRAYDGALHSTLTITTGDTLEFVHSFDDENPHQELIPLMKVVRKLEQAEDNQR